MSEQHISFQAGGDARKEGFERTASRLSGFITPTITVPSPNLALYIEKMKYGNTLGELQIIADKMERGDTLTEDEEQRVYDDMPLALAAIQDLIGMCQRREEALAECDVRVGAV